MGTSPYRRTPRGDSINVKYASSVVLFLLILFLVTQYVGLFIVGGYIQGGLLQQTAAFQSSVSTSKSGAQQPGNFTVYPLPSVAGVQLERPPLSEGMVFPFIVVALLLGTGLVLVLRRLKGVLLWRGLFFVIAAICLTIAFGRVVLQFGMPEWIASAVGIALAFWKVFRPNFVVHNATELFMYGGLAVVLFPVLTVWNVLLLLGIVSVYDMCAVWGSKHMIKMADFQSDANVFAGLMLPDTSTSVGSLFKAMPRGSKLGDVAVLGGGDMGFSLLFASVMLKAYGLWAAMIIPPFVAISLLMLLMFGKADRFYPAMPFITLSCIAGWMLFLGVTVLF